MLMLLHLIHLMEAMTFKIVQHPQQHWPLQLNNQMSYLNVSPGVEGAIRESSKCVEFITVAGVCVAGGP